MTTGAKDKRCHDTGSVPNGLPGQVVARPEREREKVLRSSKRRGGTEDYRRACMSGAPGRARTRACLLADSFERLPNTSEFAFAWSCRAGISVATKHEHAVMSGLS